MKTSKFRNAGWLVAAGLIAAALIAPSASLAADVYATVDGYAPGTSDNNKAETWETGDLVCEKIYDPKEGDPQIYSWKTDMDYALVVVKAGSDASTDFANTLFKNTKAGEIVWADTNGNGAFDAEKVGDVPADKGISHIIVCNPKTTTTTTTTAETTTTTAQTTTTTAQTTSTTAQTTSTTTAATTTTAPVTTTSSVASETTSKSTTANVEEEDATPPSTDTLSAPTGGSPTESWRFLLLAGAGILGGVLLLTPSRVSKR